MEPGDATALVRSARFYSDALWIAEAEPDLAWLFLVSALEATNSWPLVGLSFEPHKSTRSRLFKKPHSIKGNFEDKDQRRFEYVAVGTKGNLAYLELLRKVGAIRDDDGQAVFMHRSVRTKLRDQLQKQGLISPDGWEIKAHQGIADWYLKLYRASGDVAAAIESLYHRISCIGAAVVHGDNYMRESAATEARVTLRLMRPTLAVPVAQPHMWEH
jgi:hypothetical protein